MKIITDEMVRIAADAFHEELFWRDGTREKAARDALAAVAPLIIAECAQACEEHSWSRVVSWWLKATKKEVSEVSAHECAAAIRALAQEGE